MTQNDGGHECSESFLEMLADDCTRRILVETETEPLSAKELTERCPVSTATVYRRINSLVEHGLIRERVSIAADATRKTVYEPTFSFAEVSLTTEGFDVRRFEEENEAVRLARLLSKRSFDDLDVTIEGGELCLRVDLGEEVLEDMAGTWMR